MVWLKNKDIGGKLGVENIYDLIDKGIKGRFKARYDVSELTDHEKCMCTCEDIKMSVAMHCRVPIPETIEFKTRLRFNQHNLK